ncbi:hypothetical protein [Paludisphaera sp.]|uniref:hypothetical protein n=1 Tax=Paludisphaera sp. TaxID=2017432 RepID=UPI00301C3AA9
MNQIKFKGLKTGCGCDPPTPGCLIDTAPLASRPPIYATLRHRFYDFFGGGTCGEMTRSLAYVHEGGGIWYSAAVGAGPASRLQFGCDEIGVYFPNVVGGPPCFRGPIFAGWQTLDASQGTLTATSSPWSVSFATSYVGGVPHWVVSLELSL